MAKITLNIDINNSSASDKITALKKEIQGLAQTLPKLSVNKDLTAQVDTLRKSFANLGISIKNWQGLYPEKAFSELSIKAKNAFEEVKRLEEGIRNGTADNKKAREELARLNKLLKQYSADASEARLKNEKLKASNPFTISQAQQIPRLIKQYSTLLSTIKNTEKYYPKGTFDTFKNDLMTGQTQLNALNTEFQTTGTLTESSQTQLNNLANGFNQLNASVAQTQSTLKSTKGGLADIVSGFLKFQLSAMLVMKPLQLIRSALSSINETLVKTEDSVIALQRVLPSGSASDSEISGKLYQIAQDYGQTFENVSQIAQNFARTGMSWADTIKATEAAVLALNVAELDAEEATNGLIAILSQFGLEASDLETVIDKLNKTADNFPVTTEKILAALQRTGSAADNANLSLDQTIALITALSKATGRSGENIGTALNSLIQYSSKSSALDTFAKLSDESAKVVENFRKGLKKEDGSTYTILDVWQQVSKEIKNIKSEQADLLDSYFATDDGNALKEALDGELEDIYTELGGVYDTANTFRKNYFIALLGNMDTVKEAIGTLDGAAGYSQAENQKYLDTYTAKLNTLKAQWEDIANSEHGLLGIKKIFVNSASAVLTFTQSLGGLRTVLIAVGSTLGSVFGGKIIGLAITNISKLVTSFRTGEKSFKSLLSTIGNAVNPLKKFQGAIQALKVAQDAQRVATEKQNQADAIRNGQIIQGMTLEQADTVAKNAQTAATNAATIATKAWGSAIQTALGWIGLLVSGVSMIVGIIQQIEADRQARIEKERQEREQIIQTWEAIKDEAIAFAELNKQYEELKNISNRTADQEKEFLSVQESIVKALGYKAVALKKLQEGTEEYQVKLEELTQAEIKRYAIQAQSAANAAKKNVLESNVMFALVGFANFDDYFEKYGKELQDDLEKSGIELDLQNFQKNGRLTVQGSFSMLEIYRKYLEAMYDNGFGDTKEYSDAFKLYDEARKQSEEYLTTQAQNEAWKYLSQNGLPQTQEEIDSIVNTVIKATGATENWRDTIEGVVVELTGFKQPKKEIEDWSNDITKVKGKYDDLISKLEELRDLQKESTEWEEKKLAVMEAEQALENAKNEATVRRFNQATGQWEWQTDEKKIAEAEKNLDNAKENLSNATYDEIIKMLENKTATNDKINEIVNGAAKYLGDEFAKTIQAAFKELTGVDFTLPVNPPPSESHDNGGLALGKGFINKATNRPESVNNPELTKKILSPVSNAEFNRYVRDMGIMFERSHQYAQAPIIERIGGAVDNRVNNSGQVFIQGVNVGTEKRDGILDALSLAPLMSNN